MALTGLHEFSLETSPLEGINLIEANAGTGKTYTIEGIYCRLVAEQDIPVENILVVTFMENAAAELKERICSRLRREQEACSSDRMRQAIDTFDSAAIFTIHGFCRKVLAEFAFESNTTFDAEIVKSIDPFVKEISEDYWRALFYDKRRPSAALLRHQYSTPDVFCGLFRVVSPLPHIRTIPPPENSRPDEELADVDALFQTLERLWEESAGEIENLLQSGALNGKKYSKRHLAARLKAVRELFRDYRFDGEKLQWFFQSKVNASTNREETPPHHPFFERMESFADRLSRLQITIRSHFLNQCRQQLRLRMEKRNFQSFNDLLTKLHSALVEKRGEAFGSRIAHGYQAALIDEFQDTDPIQYEIFHRLFAKNSTPVFFIGDPKQSIYGFRGGDIFTYAKAKNRIRQEKGGHSYTLSTNYRSDKRLTQAINTIFHHCKNAFQNPDIEYFSSLSAKENEGIAMHGRPTPPFQLWLVNKTGEKPVGFAEAEKSIVDACCSEIVRLLDSEQGYTIDGNPISPQDICILTRTHRQAISMHEALSSRNVPCALQSRLTIFDSEEFSELFVLLRGIANFKSASLVKRALVTSILGADGKAILALSNDDAQWEAVIDRWHQYHAVWQQKGVYPMLAALFKEAKVRERMLRTEFGQRKLANLLQSAELLHAAEKENGLGISGLLAWAQRAVDSEKTSEEEEEVRLETNDSALRIMTIHSSKGLEFPVVFCPFSWKPSKVRHTLFHRQNQIHFDLGSPSHQINRERATEEVLAENIRLLYVALTRARHLVYLFWGRIRNTAGSPIAQVLHAGEPSDLWDDLRHLPKKSGGNIQICDISRSTSDAYDSQEDNRHKLQCKSFGKRLKSSWTISSYSSLAKNIVPDGEEENRSEPIHVPTVGERPPALSRFRFPQGTRTGVCIHEIFEQLDFQERDSRNIAALVAQKLSQYAIGAQWNGVITEMVIDALHVHLGCGIRLNRISMEARKSEMEFFFPLQNDHAGTFRNRTLQAASDTDERSIAKSIGQMDIGLLQGTMKGYIDLVFRWNSRYYILDWKTNYLGAGREDYDQENLKRYMERRTYALQYYIYTLALHKFLQSRIAGYRYESHMGGVFYLFVRGIARDSDTGIFYKEMRSHGNFVRQLESFFFAS